LPISRTPKTSGLIFDREGARWTSRDEATLDVDGSDEEDGSSGDEDSEASSVLGSGFLEVYLAGVDIVRRINAGFTTFLFDAEADRVDGRTRPRRSKERCHKDPTTQIMCGVGCFRKRIL
jgi:hypothetical protein